MSPPARFPPLEVQKGEIKGMDQYRGDEQQGEMPITDLMMKRKSIDPRRRIIDVELMKHDKLTLHAVLILTHIHQKRDRDDQYKNNVAPTLKRIINMILGGLQSCNDYVCSIKEYERKAVTSQKWSSKITNYTSLTFS